MHRRREGRGRTGMHRPPARRARPQLYAEGRGRGGGGGGTRADGDWVTGHHTGVRQEGAPRAKPPPDHKGHAHKRSKEAGPWYRTGSTGLKHLGLLTLVRHKRTPHNASPAKAKGDHGTRNAARVRRRPEVQQPNDEGKGP